MKGFKIRRLIIAFVVAVILLNYFKQPLSKISSTRLEQQSYHEKIYQQGHNRALVADLTVNRIPQPISELGSKSTSGSRHRIFTASNFILQRQVSTTSSDPASSKSHQTFQSTPKSTLKPALNHASQLNSKFQPLSKLNVQPVSDSTTATKTSTQGMTIHPKFRPKFVPTTKYKLKVALPSTAKSDKVLTTTKHKSKPTLQSTMKSEKFLSKIEYKVKSDKILAIKKYKSNKTSTKFNAHPTQIQDLNNISIGNLDQSNSTTDATWYLDSDSQKKCKDITQIVLNRMDYLQNPDNCSTARKVICSPYRAGMGSTIHHWVYCLMYAYYTNRTMIIDTSQWFYLRNVRSKDGVKDFHDLFQPITKCKYTNHDKMIAVNWIHPHLMDSTNIHLTPQVIHLPHAGVLFEQRFVVPKICHYAMPTEIFYNVVKFKHIPMAWWTGLLAQYIIRPNNYLQQFIDQSRNQLQFQSPIVGVHIRRTDKHRESKLFNIDQYMNKVQLYFNNLAKRNISITRRVFVITDEPWLINQLKSKYTNYQFIHPPLQQLNANENTTRFSALHLKHFLRDLFLLAECDHLVVTMSSNVGRLAYELHEVIYGRTESLHYTSLDKDYDIFGQVQSGGGPWIVRAKQDCHSNALNDISLIKGDIVDSCVFTDKTKTILYGRSQRLQKFGVFPAKCVNYVIDYETYPNYSEVDKHSDELDLNYIYDDLNTCTKLSVNDIDV